MRFNTTCDKCPQSGSCDSENIIRGLNKLVADGGSPQQVAEYVVAHCTTPFLMDYGINRYIALSLNLGDVEAFRLALFAEISRLNQPEEVVNGVKAIFAFTFYRVRDASLAAFFKSVSSVAAALGVSDTGITSSIVSKKEATKLLNPTRVVH